MTLPALFVAAVLLCDPYCGVYRASVRNAAGPLQLGGQQRVSTVVRFEAVGDTLYLRMLDRTGVLRVVGAWHRSQVRSTATGLEALGVKRAGAPLYLRRSLI